MAALVVAVAVIAVIVWLGAAVPSDHGVVLLAEQESSQEAAECLVNLVAQNARRRIHGPWAIEQSEEGRYRVFGVFGQEWRFWRAESWLVTSGFTGPNDFASTLGCDRSS